MLAIERCPPIEDGPGQVILTTVSHLNRFVFRLTVKDASGKSETLGVTGYHKFYSETRKAWVSAKDLHNSERLGYLQRPVTVAALQQIPGTHRVYNLTVENEHVYYVSGMGALVHNMDCTGAPAARRAPAPDNYRGRYMAERHAQGRPRLPDDWNVHHRISQEYMNHPELRDFDFHHPSNLQGVRGSRADVNVHQRITNEWAEFRRQNPNATRAQIEDFARQIDRRYANEWFQ